jgi:hypothetical protein
MNKSALGRALSALRKTHGGGGSKRRIVHDPELSYCRCVDCRKARGNYPAHLLDKPARKAKAIMSLTDEDKQWITGQLERVETALLTEFHKWSDRKER